MYIVTIILLTVDKCKSNGVSIFFSCLYICKYVYDMVASFYSLMFHWCLYTEYSSLIQEIKNILSLIILFQAKKEKKKRKQIKKPQNIPVAHTCFLVRFDNVIVPKLCKM